MGAFCCLMTASDDRPTHRVHIYGNPSAAGTSAVIAVEAIGPYNRTDVWAAHELYHANGWTDGLPIVPSTCEVVSACFEMAVADPVQLVGVEPVRGVAVTTEKLAIDAVMAGCLPTHFSGRAGLFRQCCGRSSCCTGRRPQTAAARFWLY